jgi:uncharacterized membrane protein
VTWLQRYRVRHYTGNAIWIFPLLGMVAALGAVRALGPVDEWLAWESGLHPDTARAVLGALASSMFTFIVFVCSALLIAVQLASAQLTPRIIGQVMREPVTKLALARFRGVAESAPLQEARSWPSPAAHQRSAGRLSPAHASGPRP